MFAKKEFRKSLVTPLVGLALISLVAIVTDLAFSAFLKQLLIYTFFYSIMALSLNLVNGFTGQFSLGHAGFVAIGAYVSGYLGLNVKIFSDSFLFLNFPVYAVAGGLVAAAAGYLVGLPSLRLKGDYLAIVTLGFSEIIRVSILNLEFIGGARGMYGVPGYDNIEIGEFVLSGYFFESLHAGCWMLVTLLVIWRLVRSTHGRCFLSVREDEIAAEAMGINITKTKVRAFVLSSFFAGVAGSIFAHNLKYLNPSSFNFLLSVDALIIVVLGGMGSLTGSIFAAFIVTILRELLRSFDDWRMVIYSITLIVVMIVRPQGLFGTMELPDILRKWRNKGSRND